MKDNRELIYLAALLHDIGKFYQRADTGSVSSSKKLQGFGKDESTFCPSYKGRYTHKHVLWTAQFIDDYKALFQKLVGCDLFDLTDKDNLITLAAGHHLSADQLSDYGKLIKRADCLSSGMDRSGDEAYRDDQDEQGWDAFKTKRMTSILQTVKMTDRQIDEANKKELWWHLPVSEMSLTRDYFPQKDFQGAPDYQKMWEHFLLEFNFIQANTYHAFSETLLNLLCKYTSCIPASTINFPDVSLYDHAKTTAAIAVCLYDSFLEKSGAGEAPFLLIGADFSGIQSYIYQIVSHYAGRSLKGRSFYLRMLSDALVRYLLKRLGLFQANVIYNSGGGFYLLAPNTKKVRKELADAVKVIERQMFAHHGTSLFVSIDAVEMAEQDLLHKDEEHSLGAVWKRLFDKRNRKKNNKYASIITEAYADFFNPVLMGGEAKRDVVTGEEFLPGEKEFKLEDKPIKETTSLQIKLGDALKATDYMIVSEEEITYWESSVTCLHPIGLGLHYYFISKKELEDKAARLKASADKVSVVTFNGDEFGKCNFMRNVYGIDNIYGLEFYGGNRFNGKTFEKMCSAGKSDEAFTRLGVLRMDVDNLGSIFQKGIPWERATLSRYAALSRSFDYFFSGYLNAIWREDDFRERSFIIYSGGDDLFIVGSWDVCIRMAKRIKDNFRAFTCENEAFSLSGGVAIIPEKFPIMKGAEMSAEQEEMAKSHRVAIFHGDKEELLTKNSFSFMGMPLNWDTEFPMVEELKDEMVVLLQQNMLPKSFTSKLLAHAQNAGFSNHAIKNYKTYWMLTYDMTRLQGRESKDPLVKEMITNLKTEICGKKKTLNGAEIETDYHPLELWALAARWAELELRTNK